MKSTSLFVFTTIICLAAFGCASTGPGGDASTIGASAPIGPTIDHTDTGRYGWAPSVEVEATGPSLVDLREVVPGPRRTPDLSHTGPKYIEKPISEAEFQRQQAAAMSLPPQANVFRMDEAGPSTLAPSPAGASFESLNYDEVPGSTPPDPEIAVGPSHVIAVVNTDFEVYDKNGTSLVGPTDFDAFFSGTPGFPGGSFDPNALYDESADRYFIGIDANGTDYCFAVTTGSDPTSTWNRYCFATDIGVNIFFEFPHAGIGEQAIFVGSNQFGGSPSFEGRVFAINKANAYAGLALGGVPTQSTTGNWSTPQPANLHGFDQGTWPTGTDDHYIMTELYDGCVHAVWTWTDPFGANTFTRGANIDLCASTGVGAGQPLSFPQQTGSSIQGNDFRGHQTEYHDGNIYTVQAISCNLGAGTVNCVRWAEINPVTDAVVDSGVFASNGEYRQFPSIAVNRCGDLAIGFTKGSTSMYPSIYVTGRESGDPAGTLQSEALIHAGEGQYSCFDSVPYRWGDYTGMTIAPDGSTFWYLGDYSGNLSSGTCKWANWVASFQFDACAADDIFTDGFESGDTSAWTTTVP